MEDFNFRENNFDLIRFIAATQVALVHMIHHLDIEIPDNLLNFLGVFPGVPIFFVVSGYLISASWERKPITRIYLTNRFLRIYPALWFALIVSIISVFLFYKTNFEFKSFFVWVMAQSSIVQFYNPPFLRDYGVGVLNGSLWTIPVELQFYIILPFLYLLIKKTRGNKLIYSAILFFLIVNQFQVSMLNENGNIFIFKLFGVTVFPYLYIFLFGVFFQKNILKLKKYFVNKFYYWITAYLFFSFIFGCIGIVNSGNHINPFLSLILASMVISFAYSFTGLSDKILKGNDVSYGIYIYIYHMIFVNIFISLNYNQNIYSMILCYVITLSMSFFSWKFIEHPCLKLKNYSLKSLIS
jgi:peptidoglycan/LPS O-acetylase OafA/YrhL